MQFCPNDGTRLRVRQVRSETKSISALACDKCGFYTKVDKAVSKSEELEAAKTSIKVVGAAEEKIRTLPTTTAECPKCKHTTAFWWMLQTRGGDEPTTQFFRCENCGHTWRSYA